MVVEIDKRTRFGRYYREVLSKIVMNWSEKVKKGRETKHIIEYEAHKARK